MRWFRLLLLGLASVYPLYWTAQFVLFFVPEALLGFWLGEPVRVVGLSYLQATSSIVGNPIFTVRWEALASALFFALLILALRGDRYLAGAMGITLLGQCALMPFIGYFRESSSSSFEAIFGVLLSSTLIVLGLYRILHRIGGVGFLDRLALLTLLAVLPQAFLWVAFRLAYPFFGTRFLLLLLVPLYLAAIAAALLPDRIAEPDLKSVPWTEILATWAAAALLIVAIALSSHSMVALSSRLEHPRVDSGCGQAALPHLAGTASRMLT